MSRHVLHLFRAVPLAVAALAAAGCPAPRADRPRQEPEVTVAPAAEKEVADAVEFTGRTEAVEAVEVRARVTGYLNKVWFRPGQDVNAGELLFTIDPSLYQADYDRAEGQVGVYEAKLKRLNGDIERNQPLLIKGVVSKEEFDKLVGDRDEAAANLRSSRANLKGYKVNLGFTDITSPIDGRISRNLITEGNLVKADSTVLAHVVSTGKMYVVFDVDENSLLRYEAQVRRGEIKPGKGRPGLATITLGDGTVMKGGTIDYVDVQLTRTTGTIPVRAAFKDPDEVLKAGQFVRVRLPVGDPKKAVVVPEAAVGSDQGLPFVYVVDENDKVESRRVTTGTVHDGMRVIEGGLKAGELVVVKGLLRVRDGVTVRPKRDEAK